jgi:predicted Zn-dependent protease
MVIVRSILFSMNVLKIWKSIVAILDPIEILTGVQKCDGIIVLGTSLL